MGSRQPCYWRTLSEKIYSATSSAAAGGGHATEDVYVCHQLYLYEEAVGGGLRMVLASMELEAYAGTRYEPRRRAVKLPPPSIINPHCQFHDVTTDSGGCVTVLLENPVGCRVVEEGKRSLQGNNCSGNEL